MDLVCYLYEGWHPRIRPATRRRAWMDATPESFAYRCLPLSISNAHGWEIGSPCGFWARWDGGSGTENVEVRLDPGTTPHNAAVSLFGQATVTFHVAGLFRTSPGWNLWIGGSPNHAKDGIAPLSGVIETDWSPYSFTMNWRFTRPNHWVRFDVDEPIAFFFPVQRGAVDQVHPRYAPIGDAPDLKRQFEAWSRSRDAFQKRMREDPPALPADRWQKLYYRGVDADGCPGAPDHQSKLRCHPFADGPGEFPPTPAAGPTPEGALSACPAAAGQVPSVDAASAAALARRDWLLDTLGGLRALSERESGLYRYDEPVDPAAFLDDHYAANRPCILGGVAEDWPARRRWTPEYLARMLGGVPVEYQGGREGAADFERRKDRHKRVLPFDEFLALATAPDAGNDLYLTAYNSAANRIALDPLVGDLGRIDTLLVHRDRADEGMPWIGPAGSFTPLHHDLTNNLLVQLVGRKHIVMAPSIDTPKLSNDHFVFSAIGDLTDPALDRARHPLAHRARLFNFVLEPGDALFIPIGWWHQVRALDFSVSYTYTNFRWPNHWHETFPRD